MPLCKLLHAIALFLSKQLLEHNFPVYFVLTQEILEFLSYHSVYEGQIFI